MITKSKHKRITNKNSCEVRLERVGYRADNGLELLHPVVIIDDVDCVGRDGTSIYCKQWLEDDTCDLTEREFDDYDMKWIENFISNYLLNDTILYYVKNGRKIRIN